MTLLPIIYTSLLLFFGILLIVIAISYLVFRTRKSANPIIEEEIKRQKNYLNAEKQNHLGINIVSSVPVVPIISESRSSQSSAQKYQNAQLHSSESYNTGIANKEYYTYAEDRNHTDNNYYNQNKKRETRTNYSRKPRNVNSRLEILNDSSRFRNKGNEYGKENDLKRNLEDISEYNVLSFYSDKPIGDFSNITAAQSKSA